MNDSVHFIVSGEPIPKQSTRFGNGRAHVDPRVAAWQEHVSARAREAMAGQEPIAGPVAVRLVFTLGNRRRVDADNLSKGVLDSCKNIVFEDDCRVCNLHIIKIVGEHPGVFIHVYPGGELPPYNRGMQ